MFVNSSVNRLSFSAGLSKESKTLTTPLDWMALRKCFYVYLSIFLAFPCVLLVSSYLRNNKILSMQSLFFLLRKENETIFFYCYAF